MKFELKRETEIKPGPVITFLMPQVTTITFCVLFLYMTALPLYIYNYIIITVFPNQTEMHVYGNGNQQTVVTSQ